MKYLIFDILKTGHHSEYINHLVDYVVNNDTNNIYIFVVNPYFSVYFPEIVKKASSCEKIKWLEVSEQEFLACTNGSFFKTSIAYYRLMDKYSKLHNTHQTIILYFNVFQLSFI